MLKKARKSPINRKNIMKICIFSLPAIFCLILILIMWNSAGNLISQNYLFVTGTILITTLTILIDRYIINQRKLEEKIQLTREQGIQDRRKSLFEYKHDYLPKLLRTIGSVIPIMEKAELSPQDEANFGKLKQYHDYLKGIEDDLDYFDRKKTHYEKIYNPGQKLPLDLIEASISEGIEQGIEDSLEFVTDYNGSRQNIVRSGDPVVKIGKERDQSIVAAVKNLVSNAFKYSDDQIKYWTERVEDGIQLKIEDTGIGINHSVEELVLPWFRGVDKGENVPPGTGIGLAIVQDAISKFRGEFRLENNNGGKHGVTATLFFPYVVPDYSQPDDDNIIVAMLPMFVPLAGVILILLSFILFNVSLITPENPPALAIPTQTTITPEPTQLASIDLPSPPECTEADYRSNQCVAIFQLGHGQFFEQGINAEFQEACTYETVPGLSVQYDTTGNFAYWGIDFSVREEQVFDASSYSYLYFYVRSQSDDVNNQFRIGLRDTLGNEVKMESRDRVTVSDEWSLVEIPLTDYTRSGLEINQLINLNFDYNRSDHGASNLCYSNIGFH